MPLLPTDTSVHVTPDILIGTPPRPITLNPEVPGRLIRCVVDLHLNLPGMVEVTFRDGGLTVGDDILSGLQVGVGDLISVKLPDGLMPIIVAEVTTIEGWYEGDLLHTTLRGYEPIHRMQRAKRTRTWQYSTDSAIVAQICAENGILPGMIDAPTTVHNYVAQVNQTDWEFLKGRAFETGCEVTMELAGPIPSLVYRKASGSGPTATVDANNPLTGVSLELGSTLVWFRPRVTTMGLTPSVEVRAYDPKAADVVVSTADVDSGTAFVADGASGAAGEFTLLPQIPLIPILVPGLPGVAKAPDSRARVVNNRPVSWGSSTSGELDNVAEGVAQHLGGTYAEAEGFAIGNGDIKPGGFVKVGNVPSSFNGAWIVSQARHVFEGNDGGYHVHFTVSGRADRSLLGLASGGTTQPDIPRIEGFVVGIVTNNQDLDKMGRVKVTFPWLHSSFESDWARCVQFGAGKEWGAQFIPEVGDEVLVGFEFGDLRRPYVVGGLRNGKSTIDIGVEPVKMSAPTAEVVSRGFVSRKGHRLVFDDDEPAGMPVKSGIRMGTKDEKLHIFIDKANSEVRIVCDALQPKPAKIVIEQKGAAGAIEITQTGQGGKIAVKSDGDVSVEAGPAGGLTLKGGSKGVKIESQTTMDLKASAGVKLDGGAQVEIKGGMVKLN